MAELAAIEAESIGLQPLGNGAYLHVGDPEEEVIVFTVVGTYTNFLGGPVFGGQVKGHLNFPTKQLCLRH